MNTLRKWSVPIALLIGMLVAGYTHYVHMTRYVPPLDEALSASSLADKAASLEEYYNAVRARRDTTDAVWARAKIARLQELEGRARGRATQAALSAGGVSVIDLWQADADSMWGVAIQEAIATRRLQEAMWWANDEAIKFLGSLAYVASAGVLLWMVIEHRRRREAPSPSRNA